MRFIVVDIETANYNPTSICQIGIVVLDDFKITQKIEYLIKPTPNVFVEKFSNLHGITSDMVEDAPTFDVVWDKIKHLFNRFNLCFAHNAPFDFGHIKSTLQYYGYNTDEILFPVFCTLQYARYSDLPLEHHTLECLCDYFSIENKNAHSALSDAVATSEVLLSLIDFNNDDIATLVGKSYKYSFNDCVSTKDSKKTHSTKHVSQKDIVPTNTEFDKNHPLYNKTIVITGQLNCMTRSEAYLHIKNVGGLCADNITKSTNFLVTNSTAMTGKMKKALDYQEKGIDISIITEDELYTLLASK